MQAAELWRIAESGDVRGLKKTLMESVDVNATNAEGVTALMRAAAHGHSEMVEALVQSMPGRGTAVVARVPLRADEKAQTLQAVS